MSNKHLIKVLFSFSVVIVVGLISLVVIDSFKEENTDLQASSAVSTNPAKRSGAVNLPPVSSFKK